MKTWRFGLQSLEVRLPKIGGIGLFLKRVGGLVSLCVGKCSKVDFGVLRCTKICSLHWCSSDAAGWESGLVVFV